jgi:RNA polymerase sigma-70 factor (ECF subfamily)
VVDGDAVLVDRLRAGDVSTLVSLIERHQPAMLRLAQSIVGSRAVAEEVTQDTWLAVMCGIARFEGRSSFRTWLFHILVNRAHSSVVHERRAGRPFEPVVAGCVDDGEWAGPPDGWSGHADDRLAADVLTARVRRVLDELPATQRRVVWLRDVEGRSAADVSSILGVTGGNQRVLLHRGRTRLRRLLAAEGPVT